MNFSSHYYNALKYAEKAKKISIKEERKDKVVTIKPQKEEYICAYMVIDYNKSAEEITKGLNIIDIHFFKNDEKSATITLKSNQCVYLYNSYPKITLKQIGLITLTVLVISALYALATNLIIPALYQMNINIVEANNTYQTINYAEAKVAGLLAFLSVIDNLIIFVPLIILMVHTIKKIRKNIY